MPLDHERKVAVISVCILYAVAFCLFVFLITAPFHLWIARMFHGPVTEVEVVSYAPEALGRIRTGSRGDGDYDRLRKKIDRR